MTSSDPQLLDVRPTADFLDRHHPWAASIPLEELPGSAHELPPPGSLVEVTDAEPARAERAAADLRRRGHNARAVPLALSAHPASGPPKRHLWRPSPLLIEALAAINATSPLRWTDLACGTGREAVHLATLGHRVTGLDLLPDALERARQMARRLGVAIHTAVADLTSRPPPVLPPADVVSVFRYLHRPLLPAIAAAVTPGGWVVYETFHVSNRQTGTPPHDPAHLLEDGELRQAFAGWAAPIARDAVQRDGRRFSQLVARKPAGPVGR